LCLHVLWPAILHEVKTKLLWKLVHAPPLLLHARHEMRKNS
jgi:hypothetical protein